MPEMAVKEHIIAIAFWSLVTCAALEIDQHYKAQNMRVAQAFEKDLGKSADGNIECLGRLIQYADDSSTFKIIYKIKKIPARSSLNILTGKITPLGPNE